MFKNKRGKHFSYALVLILLSIYFVMLGFLSENNTITGYVTSSDSETNQQTLPVFEDISSLSALAQGNYYIDTEGTVFWLDDESKPAIARVNFVDDSEKNRKIYIDRDGNIGYLLQ